MVRVKQFADDLGISKNKAQALINKGRSRKDGGSQILENVMKPKGYQDGGSKTNPKAPIAKVKTERLPTLHSEKQKAELKEYKDSMMLANRKAQLKNRKPEKAEKAKNPMSERFGKDGEFKIRPKAQAAYHPEFNPKQYHPKLNPKGTKGKPKGREAGGQENFGMLSVKAGIDKNPNATQADRIAGATMKEKTVNKAKGGGIAIQGLGFTGVK